MDLVKNSSNETYTSTVPGMLRDCREIAWAMPETEWEGIHNNSSDMVDNACL